MSLTKKDIEDFKKPYELPHHWKLREEFLLLYSDKYDIDRLVCLSNLFINIEIMGLVYPSEVMKEIKELGSKVKGLENYRYAVSQEDDEERRRKQR